MEQHPFKTLYNHELKVICKAKGWFGINLIVLTAILRHFGL